MQKIVEARAEDQDRAIPYIGPQSLSFKPPTTRSKGLGVLEAIPLLHMLLSIYGTWGETLR